MVGFITSILVAVAITGGIVKYMKKRSVDTPMSWGEAMFFAMIVFFMMFWVYGVVPHQWLTWADNELNWRADKLFVGPGGILEAQANGGDFPFTLTYLVLRDLVAVVIYVVALGGNMVLWSMWQKRGEAAPEKPVERSTFGRPLVREGVET